MAEENYMNEAAEDEVKSSELQPDAEGQEQPSEEDTDPESKETAGKGVLWTIIEYATIIACAYLAALFLTSFVIINCHIPSGSMRNTIEEGDRVIGSRLSYYFGDPKRGDIAIFYPPHEDEVLYIKRVVGLPGETIQVKDNLIYINGSETPLDEPYLDDENLYPNRLQNFGPYEIPENCYFMMGDNRGNSSDARAWGAVSRDRIVAKALFSYWPLNHIGWLAKSYSYDVPEAAAD